MLEYIYSIYASEKSCCDFHAEIGSARALMKSKTSRAYIIAMYHPFANLSISVQSWMAKKKKKVVHMRVCVYNIDGDISLVVLLNG